MTDLHQGFDLTVGDRAHGRPALVLMLVAGVAAIISGRANATPPVPFHTARVTQIRQHGGGSVVITTKDSVATVVTDTSISLSWDAKKFGAYSSK